jgi:hypothetical protein
VFACRTTKVAVENEMATAPSTRRLNSELYTKDFGLVPPYTAITMGGHHQGRPQQGDTAAAVVLGILNRDIAIGSAPALTAATTTTASPLSTTASTTNGLPVLINVTRPASVHGTLPAKVVNLLSGPVELQLEAGAGISAGAAGLCGTGTRPGVPEFTQHGDGLVTWTSTSAFTMGMATTGMASNGYGGSSSSTGTGTGTGTGNGTGTGTGTGNGTGAGATICATVNGSLGMEGFMRYSVSLRALPAATTPPTAPAAPAAAAAAATMAMTATTAVTVGRLANVRVHIPLANQHGLSWMGLAKR